MVAGVFAVLIVGTWPALAQAAAPSVTGITPTFGPAAGGTQVTIAGSGFTSTSTVAFGATTVTPTFLSSSELTAISPSGSGTVDITVTNQGETSATGTADRFTYDPVPAVTAVSPKTGPPVGGTKITITGSGFTAGTAVTFGGVNVPVTMNSSTSLTVVSPGGSGTVDIVVITPGGGSITGPADQFTYGGATGPPTVVTGSATNVSQTSATVNGTVDTGGQTLTSCRFEYGPNTRFALSAACASGSGTPKPVHAKLTGLTSGTTYHYRLVATGITGGTTTGPPMTFTTPSPPVVGAPRVGLLLSRVKHSRYIAELLGIQGINGGAVGQSLVLRCVSNCQHPLTTTIPLRKKNDLTRKIGLTQGLLVSKATRIVIDLAAKGKLSSYASYAFFISRGAIAVKIAKTGCVMGTTIQKCPTVTPAPAA
jgi:hypothetical protein